MICYPAGPPHPPVWAEEQLFRMRKDASVCERSVTMLFWCLARVQVAHPQSAKRTAWHAVMSKQRKRAVVACLRMAPLYNLPRLDHTTRPLIHYCCHLASKQ